MRLWLAVLLCVLSCGLAQAQGRFDPEAVLRTDLFRGVTGWYRGMPGTTGSDTLYDLGPRRVNGTVNGLLASLSPGIATYTGWGPPERSGGPAILKFPGGTGTTGILFPGQTSSFVASASVTWCFGVKPLAFAEFSTLYTVNGASNDYPFLTLFLHSGSGGSLVQGLGFSAHTDASNGLDMDSRSNLFVAGQWGHACMVYDGARAQSARVTLYANGTEVNDPASIVSTGTLTNFAGNVIMLGNDGWSSDPSFFGAMDDVVLWGRALAPGEIQQAFRAWSSHYTDPPPLLQAPYVPVAPVAGTSRSSFFPWFRP